MVNRGEDLPWHSVNSDVYHNNRSCQTGTSIEPENVRQGTANKQLCEECRRLNAAASGASVDNLTTTTGDAVASTRDRDPRLEAERSRPSESPIQGSRVRRPSEPRY